MAVVGSKEHVVIQHLFNALEVLAQGQPLATFEVKGGVAPLCLSMNDVLVPEKVALARGTHFQATMSG